MLCVRGALFITVGLMIPSGSQSQSDGYPGPFTMRITTLDYTMASPLPGMDVLFSPFDSEAIQQVPVVRIWGATPAGQNACLHLHRVRGAMDGWRAYMIA